MRNKALVAAVIFAALVGIYHVNGGFLYGNDAKPNVYLPVTLFKTGSLSFDPESFPFMFVWVWPRRTLDEPVYINDWDDRVPSQPYTYGQLLAAGELKLAGPKYYIVATPHSSPQGKPYYANTFGPGAGLTALPVFAVLHVACGGDLNAHPALLWYGGKALAAMLVAGSAVFVFLTARAFTTIGRAALVAVAYGIGTGVWPISSQTLWQHGPNGFFLAMGTFFLVGAAGSWKRAAWAGLAYSAAVACRPTSVIVAFAAGVYLLVMCVRRRRPAPVAAYVLAALPIAAALAAYNTYYFGSPTEFGQSIAGHIVAVDKTGADDLWQTPLWLGAAGLMISPSRGLLVFSPFMVFALAGLVVVWTRRRYAALWPIVVAAAALLVVAFKWFDWWGGWCYGPRPIVDTMPLLAVMLVPVIDWVWRRKAVLAIFAVLLAWSVFVQGLGAMTYDMTGWNRKTGAFRVGIRGRSEPAVVETPEDVNRLIATEPVIWVREVGMNIDHPEYRWRLWSLTDAQIGYYFWNYSRTRQTRAKMIELWLEDRSR